MANRAFAAAGGGDKGTSAAFRAVQAAAGGDPGSFGISAGGNDYGIGGAGGGSYGIGESAPGGGDSLAGTATPFTTSAQVTLGGIGSAGTVVNGVNTGIQDAQSVMDLGQKIYAGTDGGKNASGGGGADQSGKTGGAAGVLSTAGAYASAGAGLYSAVEGNGGFGGAFTGGMAGAKLGLMLGGPLGALIGGAGGAVIGAIGFGGAEKAKQYEKFQVRPHIAKDLLDFGMGSMKYQEAYDDLESLDHDAYAATQKWGPGGTGEYMNRIKPEIQAAIAKLTQEQKAGRSMYGMTAAQHHNGGLIGDFGSMATTGDQGWIHAQRGEFTVQQQQVPSHFQALQLMQSGASHSDMASYYGAGGGRSTTAPAVSSQPVHMHFHAPDANSMFDLFMEHKHTIRAAVNQSYAENSGGSDIG